MGKFEILFVDDDRDILDMVEKYLSRYDYHIQVVDNATEALELIKNGNFDLVFTDYKMPDVDGLELLAAIKANRPETFVVIVTGHGTMEAAIDAMRFGSYDFIQKPFKLDMLKLLIDRVVEEKKLDREKVRLRSRVTPRHRYDALVGMNLRMQEIYDTIDRMRNGRPNLLIRGETGTGKELIARVIHKTGDRPDEPFVTIKCSGFKADGDVGTVMETLMERFVSAGEGTLFLDEVSEIPVPVQALIYEIIRTGELQADGISTAVKARFIASTSRHPDELSDDARWHGEFKKAIGAIYIAVPPLRERVEDICLLIVAFLAEHNAKHTQKIGGITPGALDVLLTYPWPGNVIQLENVIERAFAMGVETAIDRDDLPPDVRSMGRPS